MERWLVIDEAAMPPGTDKAIREGLCAAFPADAAVFSRVRVWHDSWPAFSLVAWDGETLAGHVGVVDRTIRVGGQPVRVAGLQNVYALPPYRGTGLAARGLALAMDEARRRDIRFGLLFCLPKLHAVYNPLGWEDIGQRGVIRVEDGAEKQLPTKNIGMCLALKNEPFPDGDIHLCGNDW